MADSMSNTRLEEHQIRALIRLPSQFLRDYRIIITVKLFLSKKKTFVHKQLFTETYQG
jgi:hypothetical protein